MLFFLIPDSIENSRVSGRHKDFVAEFRTVELIAF